MVQDIDAHDDVECVVGIIELLGHTHLEVGAIAQSVSGGELLSGGDVSGRDIESEHFVADMGKLHGVVYPVRSRSRGGNPRFP